MHRKTILALALTVLAALMVVAAGCGGGGKKNASATTEAATTEAATTEATPTEEVTTTEEATTTEATTTPGIASAANCKGLADLGSELAKFSAAVGGGGNGEALKKQAELFKEFADKAPSDVRADFQVIADYFSKIADAIGNLKPGQVPDSATIAKLQKLGTEIDQVKVTKASQNITAWAAKNCKA